MQRDAAQVLDSSAPFFLQWISNMVSLFLGRFIYSVKDEAQLAAVIVTSFDSAILLWQFHSAHVTHFLNVAPYR
jgi:hypothetical protein